MRERSALSLLPRLTSLDRQLLAAGLQMPEPHTPPTERASHSLPEPNTPRAGIPMTTLVCLTVATPIVLFAALVPALLLQRFVTRGFPAQRPPPASPVVIAQLPARAAMHTSG